MKVEWIITTSDDEGPRKVQFRELYALKDKIEQMTILWDVNSYHVNIPERYFIINGGRKLFFKDEFDEAVLFYAKRNRKTIGMNKAPVARTVEGKVLSHSVTYLLGLDGTQDGKEKILLLQTSPDGKFWRWQDHK